MSCQRTTSHLYILAKSNILEHDVIKSDRKVGAMKSMESSRIYLNIGQRLVKYLHCR